MGFNQGPAKNRPQDGHQKGANQETNSRQTPVGPAKNRPQDGHQSGANQETNSRQTPVPDTPSSKIKTPYGVKIIQ
jgi:hypothetical protein